jgi:hypothetical protein
MTAMTTNSSIRVNPRCLISAKKADLLYFVKYNGARILVLAANTFEKPMEFPVFELAFAMDKGRGNSQMFRGRRG